MNMLVSLHAQWPKKEVIYKKIKCFPEVHFVFTWVRKLDGIISPNDQVDKGESYLSELIEIESENDLRQF